MTQYIHQSRIPAPERKAIKHRKWYICEACGMTKYTNQPRPTHDEAGYKHEWQPYFEIDIHPSRLTELTDRWEQKVYVSTAEWEEGKRTAYRMYTSYGIAIESNTGNFIIKANVKGTPENEDSEAKVKAMYERMEIEDSIKANTSPEREAATKERFQAMHEQTQANKQWIKEHRAEIDAQYAMVQGEGAAQYTFDVPKEAQLAMF